MIIIAFLYWCTSLNATQPPISSLPVYSPSHMAEIQKRGYIRIGIIAQSYPPFVIHHSNGDVSGIDIDLGRKIAQILGVKAVFDNSAETYATLMSNIYNKKDDIVLSGLVSIPSRAKSIYFSVPYLRSPVGLLVNRVKYDKFIKNTIPSFNDDSVKIGVLDASAYIGYIEFLYPKAHIVTFESIDKLMQSVSNGNIDACMMDDLFIRNWLAERPERAIHTRYILIPGYYAEYGIATSYAFPILGQWLDNFVREAINLSFIDQLTKKYIITSSQQ